jgi:hypothetical protein
LKQQQRGEQKAKKQCPLDNWQCEEVPSAGAKAGSHQFDRSSGRGRPEAIGSEQELAMAEGGGATNRKGLSREVGPIQRMAR